MDAIDLAAIAAFTEARLAEDDALARAVQDDSAPWQGQWEADGNHAVRTYNGHVLAYARTDNGRDGDFRPGFAAHVSLHDPARALRQATAIRKAIDVLWAFEAEIDGEWGCGHSAGEIRSGKCRGHRSDGLAEALRAFAAIWDDHPDYREGWRP